MESEEEEQEEEEEEQEEEEAEDRSGERRCGGGRGRRSGGCGAAGGGVAAPTNGAGLAFWLSQTRRATGRCLGNNNRSCSQPPSQLDSATVATSPRRPNSQVT